MKKHIRQFVVTLCTFLAFDAVWLGVISPKFYRTYIDHLLAPSANLIAAAFFYIIFIAGMVFFAVAPAAQSFRPLAAFGRGAFFGFVTYATFDLTSQAVFRDWPTIVTVVDLIWGTLLSGATTLVAARLTRVRPW